MTTTQVVGVAGAALRRGEVIAFPTDTLWGVGALAALAGSRDLLLATKKRTDDQFQLLVGGLDEAEEFATLTDSHRLALRTLWPGALTAILPKKDNVDETIGLRVPRHPELVRLIRGVGPLIASSANLTGESPARSIQDVQRVFPALLIFDAPPYPPNKPSTVCDFTKDQPKILREGTVKLAEIEAAG